MGFVRGIWYGTQGDYHALVMNLLGPNLFQLMGYCGGHFSLKTVLMLGEQMVCCPRHTDTHTGSVHAGLT